MGPLLPGVGLKDRLVSFGYFLIVMYFVSYGLLVVVRGYLANFIMDRVRKSRTPPSSTG